MNYISTGAGHSCCYGDKNLDTVPQVGARLPTSGARLPTSGARLSAHFCLLTSVARRLLTSGARRLLTSVGPAGLDPVRNVWCGRYGLVGAEACEFHAARRIHLVRDVA